MTLCAQARRRHSHPDAGSRRGVVGCCGVARDARDQPLFQRQGEVRACVGANADGVAEGGLEPVTGIARTRRHLFEAQGRRASQPVATLHEVHRRKRWGVQTRAERGNQARSHGRGGRHYGPGLRIRGAHGYPFGRAGEGLCSYQRGRPNFLTAGSADGSIRPAVESGTGAKPLQRPPQPDPVVARMLHRET